MSDQSVHETVLLEPAVAALLTDEAGFYVDGTFGRGGHSRLILKHLRQTGRLLAINKDPERSEERRVGKECRSRWSPYH